MSIDTPTEAQSPSMDSSVNQSNKSSVMSSEKLAFRRRWRHLSDKTAKVGIAVGGISVIVAILLIFAYLFYEVVPLFAGAKVEQSSSFALEDSSENLHLAIEEQSEMAMRLGNDGVARFFDLSSGESVASIPISLPEQARITSFSLDSEQSGLFALGLATGEAVIARYTYDTRFAELDNRRILTPKIEYPFGEAPYKLTDGKALASIALRTSGENMVLAATAEGGELSLLKASKQTSLFAAFDAGSSAEFEIEEKRVNGLTVGGEQLFIDGDRFWLFVINDEGLARLLNLRSIFTTANPQFEVQALLTEGRASPTDVSFLLGGISLLVADDQGAIAQWFLTRRDDTVALEKIRSFEGSESPVISLSPEQRRKNFVSVDSQGVVSLFNTTARRQAFSGKLAAEGVSAVAISPRGDALLIEASNGQMALWNVENKHPEVSWSALWSRVWYEGYGEPDFIWQSSAASNEFEPKYSLVPLSFGTLKAAFYAMLLAAPLAICGAIFTGYFMAPMMRRKVKPLIELMEALPTVVLGFLAGLWLAPFVENNLLGIFTVLVLLPTSILLVSFVWVQLPNDFRHRIPDGWEAGILVPVIIAFTVLSFAIATPLEALFFGGDMRFYLTNELGISYDQRNAMVVGFAMGFAVIPTIFSIAEDAIFTVPKHLTYGSLALGATPWQSLYRVVLPTASPGIFSALMIGMGRAVGETMIVLMATGNTPIMDINIFEGMRTLAANIAVEIPESEVDSTHYRILFLAALVLFMFTFMFNTVAEVIRQRLRDKYSTI
ncbi:MAG: ABC transporter permease subunit [Proteobacteria bacterium]|nr:ABC transporter permease subunit [Pseudomonadota bacterium]MDA1244219.1 ABC transporter permease subunit [Pseudomonadota bacterium]